MKKETLRLGVVALFVLIAYNLAVFMIPCLKTPTFWISWFFSLLSFGVGCYSLYISLIKKSDARSRFYGFPIARIGIVYLIAQVAIGGVFMALGHIIPWWLATVLFAIFLALAVIGLVSAEAIVYQIQELDQKLKKDVSIMRGLQSKVTSLASQCDEPAVRKLAESFLYSDPVSNRSIIEAETELSVMVDALQAAILAGKTEEIQLLCRKTSAALDERNRLCKLNK